MSAISAESCFSSFILQPRSHSTAAPAITSGQFAAPTFQSTRVRPLLARDRTNASQGISSVAPNRTPSFGLFRRREAWPFVHLHARYQLIAALLGTEDRGFAFLHIEPVLAERIHDVRLVRDDQRV